MKNMKNITFNEFCNKFCDGLYDPRFNDNNQCSGYLYLKKIVIDKITPASISETIRWETEPTQDELHNIPDLKYLRFLHPILRPFIIENWDFIKSMEIENK